MRVIRIAEVEHVPIDTGTPISGWIGGEVRRTRQPLIPEVPARTSTAASSTSNAGAPPVGTCIKAIRY